MSSTTIIGANVTANEAVAQFELGANIEASDGTKYKYVQASEAITAGDFVTISSAGLATKVRTTAGTQLGLEVGVADTALTSSYHGCVTVEGNATGSVAANCAANAKLYTTATAGVLDDESSGQTLIGQTVAITAVVTAGTTTIRLGKAIFGDY